MLVKNPNDFKNCNYTIEKMAKMQHYGLPTRLLDLTKNPLIALYFACENIKKVGEIIFFKSSDENECYFDSEEVSIIANLSQIDEINETDKNGFSLINQFVKSEISQFSRKVEREDLEKCLFVKTNYENQRIRNQQGSFLLCGIKESKTKQADLESYKLKNKEKKKIIFFIQQNKKEKILSELARINITKEFIYPEIDDVASFLKEKYKR